MLGLPVFVGLLFGSTTGQVSVREVTRELPDGAVLECSVFVDEHGAELIHGDYSLDTAAGARIRGEYFKGSRTGRWRSFHSSGAKWAHGSYRPNERHGEWLFEDSERETGNVFSSCRRGHSTLARRSCTVAGSRPGRQRPFLHHEAQACTTRRGEGVTGSSGGKQVIEVGKRAPAFTLPNQNGEKVALTKLKDSWVVLYFYPRDDTPGCTVQACDFSKGLRGFEKLDAVVLGCSPDSSESHRKFIAKHKLKIDLLCDPDHGVMEKYGAWGEKTLYGRKSVGVIRSTVLIDPAGKVAHHWARVRTKGHADKVAEKLEELRAAWT